MLKDVLLRVLNSTVGEYFDNIDASQLQLSVFGGDVALHDLNLKANICESLGLPFRLSAGRCGTLTLKIPWTSLYSQPVEIGLKDLYLLVVPGSSIAYDEVTEESARQKAKIRLVESIEAAQREFNQMAQVQGADGAQGPGYLEKLAMQILRNLQIRIESIHIRYEDDQANPGKPFVVGAVMNHLSILTTDADWNPKYIADQVATIHKLLNLDGLALYWNCDTFHISRDHTSTEAARVEQLRLMLEDPNFDYMVGPITTTTKLIITPNPEKGPHPFSTPKMIFETVVQELALAVSNLQFQDILQLAEMWDYLYRRQQYRKHRPAGIKTYKRNYKVWWKFAYECILDDIKRRRNNWRWSRMKAHRHDCKAYYAAEYKKTIGKKVSPDLDEEINKLECKLDIFNLLLIRKQIDLCRERKEKEEAKKPHGWFSGWFGAANVPDSDRFIPEEMSTEEKEALQAAIGYNENSLPVNYPPEFVGVRVNFRLDNLKFLIFCDERKQGEESRETILDLQINQFETMLDTRPVKSGLKLSCVLGGVEAFGGSVGDATAPHIMSSRNVVDGVDYFMDLGFEQSPLNSNLDQILSLKGHPLKIIYDAHTTQKLLDCFTLPQQVSLQRLQAKALSKYYQFKSYSAAGIVRMVENRGKVEMNINLQAPYILIPQNGVLSLASNVLVIELGEFSIRSKPPSATDDSKALTVKDQMTPEYLQLVSYDSFLIELRDFQVSLAFAGEYYRSSKTGIPQSSLSGEKKKPPIHLLKSGVVVLKLDQCIVPDDSRFPKVKIHSTLPLVDFDIPEHRLMQLVNLIVTLPLPKADSGQTASQTDLTEDAELNESLAVTQISFFDPATSGSKQPTEEDAIQFTELLLEVSIEAIKIRVSRLNNISPTTVVVETMMSLELYSLSANLTVKTFGTSIDAKLGGITFSALGPNEPLYLIKTPKTDLLLHIHVFTVTPDCPKLHSRTVKQHVEVELSSLETTLHREVLVTLIDFINDLSIHIAQELLKLERSLELREEIRRSGNKDKNKKKQQSLISSHTRALAKKFGSDGSEVLLKVEAKLNQLTVNVARKEKNIMRVVMGNLNGSFVQQSTKSETFLQLIQFNIINLDPTSHYKKIVSVDAERVMFIHVTKFEDVVTARDDDVLKCDMKIKVETGSPKIHILGSFLVELVSFANEFQSATSAVKEVSAAAAEAATKNVKQAYGNDSRISLDIELRAPKIVLPKNDKSLTVLMFDFGNLRFTNVFSLVQAKDRNAIVDEMAINIENVKISRAQLDVKTQESICECLLLDPVTFTGKVRRNLSSDWFQGIPALGFNGKLLSTVIRISSEDYEVVMSCILDKLKSLDEVPSSIPLHQVGSSDSSQGLFALEQLPSTFELDSKGKSQGLSLELDLSLNNLGAVLYQGSSRMEGKKGLVPRDPKKSLAEFLIDSIVANVGVSNDDSLNCEVTLGNLELLDSRPHRRGGTAIRNLIERRTDAPHTTSPMIKFSAKKSPQEIFIELNTTSLTLLLCLDHVMQVSKFFAASFSRENTVDIPAEISKYKRKFAMTNAKHIKGIRKKEVKPKKSLSQMVISGSDVPLKGNFKLEAMEIVFVESMDTIHTNAVLLNCEITLNVSSVGDYTDLTGMIDDVRLNTCNFNPEHRSQSLAEVVSPTRIMVIGKASIMDGLDLEVSLTDIFVRLSAGTVELLTKISESFSVSEERPENTTEPENSGIWEVKPMHSRDLWYLEPGAINDHNCITRAVPEPATFTEDIDVIMPDVENKKEKLVLKSGSIVLTFEAGSEIITAPLLLVEASVELQAVDWSLAVEIGGKIQLAAAYFNAVVGMWEFLVDPVPIGSYSSASWKPLEILFSFNEGQTDEFSHLLKESATSLVCSNEPMSEGIKRGSEMVCTFQCNDVMEFTVTRTAVHVLTLLGDTFNAARKTLVTKKEISTAPYLINNDTGMEIIVDLNDTPFGVTVNGETLKRFRLESGFEMELSMANDYAHYSILKEQQTEEDRWIRIAIAAQSFQARIPVSKAEVRCYPLKNGDVMTCEVWVKDCSRVVTFRGSAQIINALNVQVDVLTNSFDFIGTVQPKDRFNVPLKYLKNFSLYFAPARFKQSLTPFDLSQSATIPRVIRCPNYAEDKNFYVKILSKSRQAMLENTKRFALNCVNNEIWLEPSFLINNMLPVSLAYIAVNGDEIESADKGKMIQVTDQDPVSKTFEIPLRVKGYEGLTWECRLLIGPKTERLSAWTFVCTTESRVLTLGVHKDLSVEDQLIIHIYAPFWMINRTGMNLSYKIEKEKEVTRHPVEKGIVLFSYPATDFFNKTNKARVKPDDADWSSAFATETVGLGSFLVAKSASKNYQFALSIKLCHGGLTKMIIFTPKFYLMNQCSYVVNVAEEADSSQEEISLQPQVCVPFWPKGVDQRLRARIEGTEEKTKGFYYEMGHTTCLSLNNKYGGLLVDVNVAETRIVITLSSYEEGKAENLFINATQTMTLGFRQEGQDRYGGCKLGPGESQLICWPVPTEARVMIWYPVGSNGKPDAKLEFKDLINADVYSEFEYTNEAGEKRRYYWISFIEDLQRLTVLAEDEMLGKYLKTARDVELPNAEIVLMFSGLGLSLVDNYKCKEIIYLRMSSWGVMWEEELSQGKLRPFPKEDSDALEGVYQSYIDVKSVSKNSHYSTVGMFKLDSGVEVDLKSMQMTKPYSRPIKRCPKQPGFWSHIKLFPHSTQFHLKINRLQIDNQLPDATFVFLLSPVAQPKSVAVNESDGRKPFIEMVFMQGNPAHSASSIIQFIYCSLLVQEFQVKLDMGLVNAIAEMFTHVGSAKANKMMEDFKNDFTLAMLPIEEHQRRTIVSIGSKRFYNYLHLSPLKVRVSFSMNGSSQDSSNVFLLLLQGLGMDKLADFQDVPFQLACFELRSKLLSDDQLSSMVISHYTTQGIKQFYVLILGLDFLGNPYALITGITEGIGAFFYEPIQGAILGPDAFREGLSLGLRSLVGHTVGGAAEALSKVTGTIGKAFAALTVDSDFQQRRNEQMRQQGGPGGSSFANTAGRFFKTGIFDTMTGIVTNPIKGAQEEGLQGFGKGLFRGAVGILTRPVVGAADLARGTLDSFRRAVQEGEDMDLLRPPRPVRSCSALKPYNIEAGKGNQIMQELIRREHLYLKTETYIAHCVVNSQALLLTDRRVFYLKLTDNYGGAAIIWEHEYVEFAMPPYIVEKGIEFQLNLANVGSNKKPKPNIQQLYVPIYDPHQAVWILNALMDAMAAESGVNDSVGAIEQSSSSMNR